MTGQSLGSQAVRDPTLKGSTVRAATLPGLDPANAGVNFKPHLKPDLRQEAATPHLRVVGVDEVGYGAWAGPITVAAAWINPRLDDPQQKAWLGLLADSKKLTPARRQEVVDLVTAHPDWASWVLVDVPASAINGLIVQPNERTHPTILDLEVGHPPLPPPEPHTQRRQKSVTGTLRTDAMKMEKVRMERGKTETMVPPTVQPQTVLTLTLQAMAQAARQLQAQRVLVDGIHPIPLTIPQNSLIKGDGVSASIALASILAKVARDRHMNQLGEVHPSYGWAKNKGYGTQAHQQALRSLGLTSQHRRQYCQRVVPVIN